VKVVLFSLLYQCTVGTLSTPAAQSTPSHVGFCRAISASREM
jgi:hypothetical protein